MVSKESRVKVMNITHNLIFGVTDTGLNVTARIIDLMLNPEIYSASVAIPCIAYHVPICNEEGNVVKELSISPFTRSNGLTKKGFCIVKDDEVLSWSSETGFSKDKKDAIIFLTEEYAKAYASIQLKDIQTSIKPYKQI